MKTRKFKPVKSGSSRRKEASDVSPSTSLPPLVEGQLRCFLRVTVSRILWTIPKPPPATLVRLRWWGESSYGTHFCPRDGSKTAQKTVKTTSRFPIRCGPKQFTSYITDMGSLVLEILTKLDHLPIARAQVSGISRLSLSHSISGFYSLVSPTSEKLGELQVFLALEALTETYESSSSVPTTDISMEVPNTLVVPSLSRPLSANSGKGSVGSNSATPRGKDHLYFQSAPLDKRPEVSLENQMPTGRSQHRLAADNLPEQEKPQGHNPHDILSVLLERGSKLRNAMVVSALNSDSELAQKDSNLSLPKKNILQPLMPSVSPYGNLLQNILHADSNQHSSHALVSSNYISHDHAADTENLAVDLLLGSLNGSALPLWDGEGSPPESLSGHSSVCRDSELNDPQYDQSLIENLFYKTPISDSSQSDIPVKDREVVSLNESNKDKALTGLAEEQLRLSSPSKNRRLNSVHERSQEANDMLPSMSMDQLLTVLAKIRLARVVVLSLPLPTQSNTNTPRKGSGKGKPPRPLPMKKCSYFVEYLFPVASSRHDSSQVVAAEVTRVVSSKVTGGVVRFQQSSVFPVHFTKATIEQWLDTYLTFKIHSRKSCQKKPVPLGKATYPLRCLLRSEQLSQTIVLPVQNLEGTESRDVGPLKVSVELAADNNDFSSAKQRSNGGSVAPANLLASPQRGPSPPRMVSRHQDVEATHQDFSTGPRGDSAMNPRSGQRTSHGAPPLPSFHTSPCRPAMQVEEDYEVLLHALLMVPDGKDFNCGPMQPPNIYLNCKLLWTDETTRSVISWGQTHPTFNFAQVTPVALTTRLLERMKNNMTVIEVWQRPGSSRRERLLGLVKLPLHQFYVSFRDPKITHLLLQAQYPVLGVDSYMPVIDVFSGSCRGNLRVLLAMGESSQIVALQRMRDEELGSASHLPRPLHLLDHRPHSEAKENPAPLEAMREHVFVVRVEKVKGLTPLQSTVWGEADCYIQYNFPSQDDEPPQHLDPNLIESSVNLKQFRTTTTLCVPDPMFGHSETHVLLAPASVPVQRLLLSSFSTQGLANGGGIQFEVWCRYYYPNVRDQQVARGMLPLSKLCAMITMQKQQPPEAQVFSLPLVPRTDNPGGHQPQPSGLLDVCIHYKHRPVRPEDQRGGAVASRIVTLVIQVHRAAGLQAAARALAEQDETFQYYSEVGVNTYVTAHLSFLPESEQRSTRVAARTFCPEFDHHTEFPCQLQVRRSSGETCSLAELLQEATAVFTVWNRDSRKVMDFPKSKDTLLGAVRIPLADLIHKRTGISGWFGLSPPQDLASPSGRHILVGGLEISVNFAHHADRERVVTAARGLGWEVGGRACEVEEPKDDDDEEDIEVAVWGESARTVSLTVAMPRAWLPVRCLLLPGHEELQRSTYCYFRYKLYDREAFCSQLRHPSVEEGGQEGLASVVFKGARTVELRSSQPLLWYLREERLEVQVWVAFRKERTPRPHDTDRLVGSAFVDLSPLAKRKGHKLTLSGVYPLFRRAATDLSGAALRVHISLDIGSATKRSADHNEEDQDSQVALTPGEEEQGSGESSPPRAVAGQPHRQSKRQSKSSMSTNDPAPHPTEESSDGTFSVTINVDRAMHLSLKGCPQAERSGGMPCCCVTYVTADADEPVSTAVVADSGCPVWDDQQECRLPKQLLVDPLQSLVFKVWHRGELERVIGFVSVDLSPLLSGFQSVCGWYNITDFSGQCQGQLKVAISPLKGVQDLRAFRQVVSKELSSVRKDSSTLFQNVPLYYHTNGSYSSFPSHISHFPEQKIYTSPEPLERRLSESESDRHDEHVDNVRLYHQSLQAGGAAHPRPISSATDPSSSVLFSALRKNLRELDDIQRYFSRKLSTHTFPSLSEQGSRSRAGEPRDPEAESGQLLLKSSQLVGEVNSLISGLQGGHLETISSNPQSCSTSPPNPEDPFLSVASGPFPNSVSWPLKGTDSPRKDVSPIASPTPGNAAHDSDSKEEGEEEEHLMSPVSEEEDCEGGGYIQEEDEKAKEEEEEDEDYEETVVEPRALNEVTSLTDKTSPWTSMLSDPDFGTLESPEATEEQPATDRSEPNLDRAGDRQGSVQLESPVVPGCTRAMEREEVDSNPSDRSGTDGSDTEGDDERTFQAGDPEQGEASEPEYTQCREDTVFGQNEGDVHSEGESPRLSLNPEHIRNTPLHQEEGKLQHPDSVEIPNFFLPSHHLEASMRALCLAPAFPLALSESEHHGIPYRRALRPRPNIPPSSTKKEETKRIAKIFSSNFNEEQ